MTDKQELTGKDEPTRMWQYLLSRWARAEERSGSALKDTERSEEEPHRAHLVNTVIAVLAPRTARGSQTHDLDIMYRLISSVHEAAAEKTITKNEAHAVMEFLVAKFVERRFNGILLDTFDLESSRRCTFHGVAGRVKHGREEETTR